MRTSFVVAGALLVVAVLAALRVPREPAAHR
jgi:hypothetical protein